MARCCRGFFREMKVPYIWATMYRDAVHQLGRHFGPAQPSVSVAHTGGQSKPTSPCCPRSTSPASITCGWSSKSGLHSYLGTSNTLDSLLDLDAADGRYHAA